MRVYFNLSTSPINDSCYSLNLSSRLLERTLPMLVLDVGVLSDSFEETSLLCSSCGSITATLAVTISAAVQNIVEDEPSGVQRQIRSVKRKFNNN